MDKLNAAQTRAARLLALRTMMGGTPDTGPGGGMGAHLVAQIAAGYAEGDDDVHAKIKDELEGREARYQRMKGIAA